MNNYNQALLDFTKLLMLKNNAENYVNRARIYLEMNDTKNVLSDLFKAIQQNNNSYDAYYNRALVYHDKLEYDSAVSDLQKCIDIRPGDDDAGNKLLLLQKFMEIKNDTLDNVPLEIKYITDSWMDDFRDTQTHIEHHKKPESNIFVASKLKNDNGIKRVINSEQPSAPDRTVTERSVNKNIPQENPKRNESNDSIVSNNTIVNNSIAQNNGEFNPVSQDKIDRQSADKNGIKISIAENPVVFQKMDYNSMVDFNKTGNNATGKQNSTEEKISSADNTEEQVPEFTESQKVSEVKIEDISMNGNELLTAKDSKKISETVTAQKSNSIQKLNTKYYTIQLGAFENEENAKEYEQKVKDAIDYDINTYQSSDLFKIRTGNYQLKDALSIVRKIRQAGFTDAIIVESVD